MSRCRKSCALTQLTDDAHSTQLQRHWCRFKTLVLPTELREHLPLGQTSPVELALRLTETAYGDGSLEQEDLVR